MHFPPHFLVSLVKLKISHMIASKTLILLSQLTLLKSPDVEHDPMSAQEEMKRLEAVSRKQFAVFYKCQPKVPLDHTVRLKK